MPLNGTHPIPLHHNGLNSHENFSTLSFVRGYVQQLNTPLALSKCICSTSKKQVFGISVQQNSWICRQIMAIFSLLKKNLPKWDST